MIGVGGGRTSKRIVVLYNLNERMSYGEHSDLDAEKDIIQEVRAVEDSVLELGYECCVMAIKDEIYPVIGLLKKLKPLCVINLCESIYGQSQMEMSIPALLDLLRIPYTGNGALALGICLDKRFVKDRLRANGIYTPYYVVASVKLPIHRVGFGFPIILKPIHEDGSLGITFDSVVYSNNELEKGIEYIIDTYKQPALVEEYIDGREFQVTILDVDGEPVALPVSEIDYTSFPKDKPQICGYDAKWKWDSIECKTSIPVCPALIDKDLSGELQLIALDSYRLMGCKGYARIDFRYNSKIYVLEINPNPDVSPLSGAINTIKAAGLSYTDFVRIIIDGALQSHNAIQR